MPDTWPGDGVAIPGVGRLGHRVGRGAKAIGLTALRWLSATKHCLWPSGLAPPSASTRQASIQRQFEAQIGGDHAVLVTAISPKAFEQEAAWRIALATCRGSAGEHVSARHLRHEAHWHQRARLDRRHAAGQAGIYDAAAQGKVATAVTTGFLQDIATVPARMRSGGLEGRVVLDVAT